MAGNETEMSTHLKRRQIDICFVLHEAVAHKIINDALTGHDLHDPQRSIITRC